MKKRSILLLLMAITLIIIQLFGIPYLGIIFSSHNIEFNFVNDWTVTGTGGYYLGYTENYHADGHYIVDFNGNVATVTAQVTWNWEAWYEGSLDDNDGGTETYHFTYSLTNGQYQSGTDMDYDTTGMNVWFHIPGGIHGDSFSILKETFVPVGEGVIWEGHLMPFNGKKLTATAEYYRDDAYGQFDATYTVDDYFTPEGYLIGEIYHEQDEGTSEGYWSTFNYDSYVFITSASYLRAFNGWLYVLTYWFPLLFFAIIFYVVYEHYRWKPDIIAKVDREKNVIIERKLPKNLIFSISSYYADLIPSYIARAESQNKMIISVHNQEKLKGIGFLEPNGKVGSFFGKYTPNIIDYSKVKYGFAEVSGVIGFKTIEKYDVYKIENLDGIDLSYDARLIQPATKDDLGAIMKLIANEDVGKPNKKYAKWVKDALKTDIVLIAIASPNDEWIKNTMKDIYQRHYPKPEIYSNKILLGVGFATPGKTSGWLYGLYVHPAFRNKGIGLALASARLATLKELGCDTAITEIAEWNGPAKRIYYGLKAEKIGKATLFGKKMPKVKVRRF